jgi:predicted dehydrogenase
MSGLTTVPASTGAAQFGAVRTDQLGVAVIGCGLIGTRRALVAEGNGHTRLRVVADTDIARAGRLAQHARTRGCDAVPDWERAVARNDVDIVIVSTSNGSLAEIAIAALTAGKHVLMEKPMGRNLGEALRIAEAAAASAGRLQIGFNHRLHPAIRRAAELVQGGEIGRLISIRARYGHGGRPGLEREWRSNAEEAGGGELLDQGVHVADLLHWLAGMPASAFAVTQTAAWDIRPLEDNAYGMLMYDSGLVAQLHVSMTQWKNLFSLEVYGHRGAVVVEGLGGSYGTERLVRMARAMGGGVPAVIDESFSGDDQSWALEWQAFVSAIRDGATPSPGASDGVAAMRIVDALYRSARAHAPVSL